MRYLITNEDITPFLTNWYDYDNNYAEGMVVYDLHRSLYTCDGFNWLDINQDHL